MAAVSGPSGYIEGFQLIFKGVSKYYHSDWSNYSFPSSFVDDLRNHGTLDREFVLSVTLTAILWTAVRYFLTWTVFLPFGRYLQLSSENELKLPECLFRMFWYLGAWLLSAYICFFSGRYDIFQNPDQMWADQNKGPIQDDIRLVYIIQLSFYVHSAYGTVFMDQKRKDTLVMLFHHFLTIILIGLSFSVRYHKIGLLVVALHDVSDVCLEFTKLNVYLKTRGNTYHAINDHISTLGFLSFAITWYINRLYFYPLRVLYGAAWAPVVSAPTFPMPFYFLFNVMLWILQLLNFYWFAFVLIFLYKVLLGQMTEVEDVREHNVDDKIRQNIAPKHDVNGAVDEDRTELKKERQKKIE